MANDETEVGRPASDTSGTEHAQPFEAAVLDMDGVITRTAKLHAHAWKRLFDEFLRARAAKVGETFVPFDADADYRTYVDGKPREAGVRSFLSSRDIVLPEGEPPAGETEASAEADTVHGLAARKDTLFAEALRERGVEVYESTIRLIEGLRAAGVKVGVVTSSRHGREILVKAGIAPLFDARIDGIDLAERHLNGKPAPDAFLACVADLGTTPTRSIAVEDAAAGVEAARGGGFGLVVGVDRGGNRHALEEHGADLVVNDLAELDVAALAGRYGGAQERMSWRIEQEGFDPARERDVESLFAIGNGYLGVRGTLDTPVPTSQGDLLIAGIYDRKQPTRPYSEHEFMDPDRGDYAYSEIVSFPFPFRVELAIDGVRLSLAGERWRWHQRVLDMRGGILSAETRYEVDPGSYAKVCSRRAASLDNLHLLLQEITVCLENHSGVLELDASLNDPDLSGDHPHLIPLPSPQLAPGIELNRYRTRASNFEISIAQRTTVVGHGEQGRYRIEASMGETLSFRRYVAVYTSRDVDDPTQAALRLLEAQRWDGLETSFAAHRQRWRDIWRAADLRVVGHPAVQQALRFHVYQLSSAADHDPRVSIGGRALTGRAYEGHVFWDVEIFLLPFFLHTHPAVARSLLMYRHHTLDGARRRAQALGQRGACYAWESTVTGDDTTPRVIVLRTLHKEIPIFTGTQQIHVTADVAFGVWRYWEATRDEAFLSGPGAEILAETARFWASRAELGDDGRYHVRGVVGPDEYHHSVDDNAYTNWMARLNLENALRACRWLEREHPDEWEVLEARVGLDAEERRQWEKVAGQLYFPEPNADGVIEQFAGFFELDEYRLPPEERFKAPIERLFDWDRINRLKLLKQADVLMLPFLFPEQWSREALAANYRYYEPRTDHGSSLSPGVHAALAARLGLKEEAERYWKQSLTLDLSNVMGNSTLGVHPACMGATWQALVRHFLGVGFAEDGPEIDPEARERLPDDWRSVVTNLEWRGKTYPVEVQR